MTTDIVPPRSLIRFCSTVAVGKNVESLPRACQASDSWRQVVPVEQDKSALLRKVRTDFTISSRPSRLKKRRTSVAICVSGQPSRLMPGTIVRNILQENARDFEFDLLFALSPSKVLHFNQQQVAHGDVQKKVDYQSSSLADLDHADQKLALEAMFRHTGAQVHVLEPIADRNKTEWARLLGAKRNSRLGVIYLYKDTQERILNTYAHQVGCAQAIETLEDLRDQHFDYIISTRDDMHFLERLLRQETGTRAWPFTVCAHLLSF